MSERIRTDEADYTPFDCGDGPEWWRLNRVYGERDGDHRTRVLDYGGLELSAALDRLAALETEVTALREDKARLDWWLLEMQPDAFGQHDIYERVYEAADKTVDQDDLTDAAYLQAARACMDAARTPNGGESK